MILEEAKRVLRIEGDAILAMIPRLDRSFEAAVEVCAACLGHLVVIGMGKSGLVGRKISATLASTGTPSFFLHPAEGIHGDLGMVSKRDVALLISNSGETEEILKIVPSLKRLQITLITFTGNFKSSLAEVSDWVIDVSIREEACSLGLAPTASTTATLAMGDALAMALLLKKGFRAEDFATFHPGGNLGRNLLLKVETVMCRGEAIPQVMPDSSMREVILTMTEKKLGMTTVLDASRHLLGIITDGDLRRFMNAADPKQAILSFSAQGVMTKNPKTIARGLLAAEAIQIMEAHSITSLVVVDENGCVEGVVHLHDLLRKGTL